MELSELKKKLARYEQLPFYSIVVFYGNCELKDINYVPNVTFLTKSDKVLEVIKTIFKENKPVNYNHREDIFQILKEAVVNGELAENQRLHKENVKDMLGKHRIFE